MMKERGCIFDIRQFTVHDGPGVRLTVFMKGCPLRCQWCHNPEGLSFTPQLNQKTRQMTGTYYTVEELVRKIMSCREMFDLSGGGVTFSGGEATAQYEFVLACMKKLPGIHKVLDTSGYCKSEVFSLLLSVTDMVYYDLKLLDDDEHLRYTGKSNKDILRNLEKLAQTGVPYHIRIPLIPSITDTKQNLSGIRRFLKKLQKKPDCIDLLPYNPFAGGKYVYYGMEYPLQNWYARNNEKEIHKFATSVEKAGYNVKIY